MQETLNQTADAGVSLSDSECRILSIRQRMQESLHRTADAGDTLLDMHPLSDKESPASAV